MTQSAFMVSRFRARCISALALALMLGLALHASAAEAPSTSAPESGASTQDAVQSGREAFNSSGHFPWYDPARDDLRPITLEPDSDADSNSQANNDSDSKSDSSTGNSSRRSRSAGGSGHSESSDSSDTPESSRSFSFGFNLPILWWIAWIAIAVILLVLAYMLIRAFLNREERAAKSSDSATTDQADDESRLDALPAPARQRPSNLLDEARRLYELGNYDEAIVYLYGHQLVELDKSQRIRLARGKTNREYLREVAATPELAEILADTMVAFEDVYFGNHQLSRARFEICWNQIDAFHRLVAQGAV